MVKGFENPRIYQSRPGPYGESSLAGHVFIIEGHGLEKGRDQNEALLGRFQPRKTSVDVCPAKLKMK